MTTSGPAGRARSRSRKATEVAAVLSPASGSASNAPVSTQTAEQVQVESVAERLRAEVVRPP
jgi:hypothetical protein